MCKKENSKEAIVITKANYQEKVIEGFTNFIKKEKTDSFLPLFSFFDSNKDLKVPDTIKSKYFYLKAANSFVFLRRYKDSEDYYLKAFKLAEKTNDYSLKGLICNDRAVLSSDLRGNANFARSLFHQAIENYEIVNNIEGQIESYYNLTLNSMKEKDWALSIEYAIKCNKLIGNNKVLKAYYKLLFYASAHSNIKLGNLKKATSNLLVFEELLKAKESKFSLRAQEFLYEVKADLEEAKGNYENAKMYLDSVLVYKKKMTISKRKEMGKAYDRELLLKAKVQERKDIIITGQNKRLLISLLALFLFLSLIIFLFFFIKRHDKKNKEIERLNTSLKSLVVSLKEKNIDLSNKKTEIEELLKQNEQTLFSRIFKISTYNDTIRKITKNIETYIDKNVKEARFLNTVNKELYLLTSEEELWEDFKIQFEKIRPHFFDKLKQVAPSLTVNDLKHCTYIVSNLKSKEVAQLINVSPRSVETTRYRIKKKMGLDKEDLYTVLSNL